MINSILKNAKSGVDRFSLRTHMYENVWCKDDDKNVPKNLCKSS